MLTRWAAPTDSVGRGRNPRMRFVAGRWPAMTVRVSQTESRSRPTLPGLAGGWYEVTIKLGLPEKVVIFARNSLSAVVPMRA